MLQSYNIAAARVAPNTVYRTSQDNLSHYTPSKQGMDYHGNIEVGVLLAALSIFNRTMWPLRFGKT